MKRLIVILAIATMAIPAMAKRYRRISNAQAIKTHVVEARTQTKSQNIKDSSSQLFQNGKNTVVELKGQSKDGSASCDTFQVQLGKSLRYSIQCAGYERSQNIALENAFNQTVTRQGEHITITKYNYLMKKPRVSRMQQSTLKVPFVEEIIHIKTSNNGEMSFYFESFKEDEFGRIVQDGFVQAHSLTNKKLKVSSR